MGDYVCFLGNLRIYSGFQTARGLIAFVGTAGFAVDCSSGGEIQKVEVLGLDTRLASAFDLLSRDLCIYSMVSRGVGAVPLAF